MLRIVVVILGFPAAAIVGKIVQVSFVQVGWYVIGISIGVAVIWSIAYVFRSFRFTRRFNQMALSDLQDKAPNFREHDTVGLDTILTFGLEAEKWLETLLKRTFKESHAFPADRSLLVTQYIRYLESLKQLLGNSHLPGPGHGNRPGRGRRTILVGYARESL